MIYSRNIDDLRADVAANCRIFLKLCEADGLDPMIVNTVRDKEYQEYCYRIGTAKTKVPSFHAQGVGLAFDICKNVAGHEYDDADFFARCGRIGTNMGFEWGGTWKSIVDKPHFQWSEGERYSSADILAGRLPPDMPLYEEVVRALSREEALKILVDKGVISSPDYWQKVCDTVIHFDELIVNVAKTVR